MKLFILIGLLLFLPACAYALEDKDCINAIIGEAESESFEGQQAIANAIHNRGHLKGVYGLTSKRVICHLYDTKAYKKACRAWALKAKDLTSGAIGWGNSADLVRFKNTKWFKRCVVTAHIGKHWFYKERKTNA